MAQAVPHQPIDRKRVKVYELRDNDWFDRGTGFCSATFVSADNGELKEPRVVVESEDVPGRLLLDTRITKEDGFQRQQETLIVWTEPSNGLDMALSFQEAEGCLLIWNFISEVQQSISATVPDDSLSEDLAMDMPPQISLPPAELGALQELENNMRIMSSTADGRDALAGCVVSEDYIRKLIPLVEMAEDLESLTDLHHLCNIVKIILLLNDTTIIEQAVSDECVLGVVGALEYDPDFPSHKANHRQWLNNQGRYKEVVRIQDDAIRRKIHQTYRLQYLKDVVLARILDDPTFSVLNSLIFFNQVDIVQHLQTNAGFLTDLFGIFDDPAEALLRKKQAVLFIQQCCAIAKNLQPPARMTLYNNFISHGLLRVINFGLRNRDVAVRVGATDILVSMIDHDPQMIRQTVYRQMHDHQPQLTDTLIDLLLVEVDLGIKSQVSDALKVLLDPVAPSQSAAVENSTNNGNGNGNANVAKNGAAAETQMRARILMTDPQQDLFLCSFYEHSAVRLFKPLMDLETQTALRFHVLNDGIYSYLNDILCFFIRQHHHRCKFFMMQHNLALRFVQLLECHVKHLQLVAVRFIRHMIALRDEFYNRHIMEKRLIEPVFDLLERCLPRDNLLCSACLEFFDVFTKDDLGDLTRHLIDVYHDRIEALSYLSTFNDLLNGKYPQNGQPSQHPLLGNTHNQAQQQQQRQQQQQQQQRQQQASAGGILISGEGEAGDEEHTPLSPSPASSRAANGETTALPMGEGEDNGNGLWCEGGEGDGSSLRSSALASAEAAAVRRNSLLGNNGHAGSPVLRQLVDYPSDDDDEVDDNEEAIEDGDDEDEEDGEDHLEALAVMDDEDGDATVRAKTMAIVRARARARVRARVRARADEAALSDEEDGVVEDKKCQDNSGISGVSGGVTTTPSPQPPRERVSEKRRREADEEDDELGKLLVQSAKRRHSRTTIFDMNTDAAETNHGVKVAKQQQQQQQQQQTMTARGGGSTGMNGGPIVNGHGATASGGGSTPAKKISINITATAMVAAAGLPPEEEEEASGVEEQRVEQAMNVV